MIAFWGEPAEGKRAVTDEPSHTMPQRFASKSDQLTRLSFSVSQPSLVSQLFRSSGQKIICSQITCLNGAGALDDSPSTCPAATTE
jgi:hypothetical protein